MRTPGASKTIVAEIVGRARAAIGLLKQAHLYANAAGSDVWEFAVEIEVLRAAGLTHNDLRWMVRHAYTEHRIEATVASSRRRRFRGSRNLAFSPRSCFVLTQQGVQLITAAQDESRKLEVVPGVRLAPHWDAERRELQLGSDLVKRFRQPASAQELILATFEEEGWPAVIDDPLSPHAGQDSKARLRVTIQNLNRNQQENLIRFVGDGHGTGIRWELW